MDRLKETQHMMGRLMKDVPQDLKAFADFVKVAEKPGAIEEKPKHLILLALAISAQCAWCIALHTKGAVDAGATKDEIIEAAMLAVVMGGGPKLMYIEVLYEELDKYFN